MYPCSRFTFWILIVTGATFVVSALIGSFWFSFIVGSALLCGGILLRRP